MARIDLGVPFAEKDEARRLGARWDGVRKVWYVPEGVSSAAFGKWLPEDPDFRVQADSYFIAQASRICWKCFKSTSVFGFVLPSGFTSRVPVDEATAGFGEDDTFEESAFQAWLDSPASSAWVPWDEPSPVYHIRSLAPSVLARIKAFTPHYRVGFSEGGRMSYWMNHCEHCGIKQGDVAMYNEPHDAFSPTNEREASGITLHHVKEAFAGCGSYYEAGSYIAMYFEYFSRIDVNSPVT